jgi:hypothetical protein
MNRERKREREAELGREGMEEQDRRGRERERKGEREWGREEYG